MSTLICLLVIPCASVIDDRPTALCAMEQSRNAIVSGTIDWELIPRGSADASRPMTSRYATRGDTMLEMHPGPSGKVRWMMHDWDRPRQFLSNRDGFWIHTRGGSGCSWWRGTIPSEDWSRDNYDVRYVGIAVGSWSLQPNVGFRSVWDGANKIVSWEQQREGNLYVVTGRTEQDGTIRWWINPDKGWNPERIRYEAASGTVLQEAECDLARFDDVWLPRETRYYVDGNLDSVVRVNAARLNQPDDPFEFTLHELDLEPGANLAPANFPMEVGKPPVWNGDAVSDWDTWIADTNTGRRQWGPTFRAMAAKSTARRPGESDEAYQARLQRIREDGSRQVLKHHERLWQDYVDGFIKRFKLDERQTQRARDIHARAVEGAEQRTRNMELEMLPLMTELQADPDKFPKAKRERLARVRDERDRVLSRVFEQQLRRPLYRLLTSEQREKYGVPGEFDDERLEKQPEQEAE